MNRRRLTLYNNHLPLNNRATSVRWLCLLFFFLLPVYGRSQTTQAVIPIEDVLLQFNLWTKKDGIPHWHLNGVFQDSRGFLWANWKGALCRFDGRQRLVLTQGRESLHEFNTTYFAEDIHNNLWFSECSEIDKKVVIKIYHPVENTFTSIEEYLGQEAKAFPFASAHFAFYSIHQVVYIVNNDTEEVWQYDGKLKRLLPPFSGNIDPHEPNMYWPAPNGCFWRFERKDEGVYLVDASRNTLAHYPQLLWRSSQFAMTDDLRLVTFSEAGPMEVSRHGIHTNPSLKQWFYPPYLAQGECNYRQYRFPGLPSHAITIESLNQLKVTKGQKVIVEDLLVTIQTYLNDKIAPFQLLNSGAHGTYCPVQLTNGTLLIPLQDGLLEVSLQKNIFTPLLPERTIRSLAISGRQLFIEQGYSDIIMLNLGDKTQRKISTPRTWIRSMLPSPEGLWYGGGGADLYFVSSLTSNTVKFAAPSYMGKNPQDEAKSILQVNDHFIWYAASSGVIELDINQGTSRYLLHGVDVNQLSRDKQGTIWACTERGLYNFSKKRYYLDTLADGQRLTVAHFYEQNPETFWLATHQGLIRWKPYSGEYRQYRAADGLSDEILHAVYPDQSGRLWLSSNNGIMSFDLKTEDIRPYFKEDGLCHDEQNQGAHAQGADGRLYFGSLGGINSFHPDSIPSVSREQMDYSLCIDRISLFGGRGTKLQEIPASLNNTEPYCLPRACQQLGISLSLPYYGVKETIIEWRLTEENSEWRPVSADNQLFLLQIPHGNFQLDFRVRLRNSQAILRSYHLIMHAPYPIYYSMLFWLLVLMFVVILASLYFWWHVRMTRVQNRELQAEVNKRTWELEVQTRKLERVDVAKTQLFNNVSHELRTPLSLILLSAEQLPGQKVAEQKQLVGQIKEQVRYITRMLEEIMDLSRLEMGMIKVETEVVNWQSFFHQNFRMLESMARHKQQDYQLKIQPAEAMYLLIDKDKIAHVLNNLIGNAIKYTPVGGRILVRSELTASEVEVVVADTGPGIPLEEQEDIFRRYYQGRHAGKQAQPGYGIGLALCKEYAELMGGRVWVESVPGEGAAFFFRFPLVDAPHAEALPAPVTESEIIHTPRTFSRIAMTDTPKNRIMVVEDNPELLALLEDILSKDYEVQLATNGEEAFELLQQQPDAFQLVLSDIMMPVVDGFGLLSKVRAHPRLGFIPFLFLSALSAPEDQLKALRLGVDGFISKPFETLDLKTRIQTMIRNQELRKKYHLSGTTDAHDQTAEAPTLSSQEDGAGEAISYNEVWLRELEAIVRKDLAQHDLKIQDIAFQLHMSERTLRTYINTYTGLSPVAYLKKARLSQAMQLIQQRKYRTVGEVAYAVGFKDAPYFSKAFKQEFGKYPMDYM